MEEEYQEEFSEEELQAEFSEEQPQEESTLESGSQVAFDEEEDADQVEDIEEDKPAVVINVRSWGTLVVGLVMLLVGFAGGIAGRSILDSINNRGSAAAPAVTEPSIAASTESPDSVLAQIPTVTAQQPSPEDQAQLMAFLVSQTNHFIGDPEAPVTIIEFSDYQ